MATRKDTPEDNFGSDLRPVMSLLDQKPADIVDVLFIQRGIDALFVKQSVSLATRAPLAAFHHLYISITSEIERGVRWKQFDDTDFMTILDVNFASLYFEALRNWISPSVRGAAATGPVPTAWQLLFDVSLTSRVTALRGASLGVNAHINHDLAYAVARSWGSEPIPLSSCPREDDFQRINNIFKRQIPILRRQMTAESPHLIKLDQEIGPIDDWLEWFVVKLTRSNAWDDARALKSRINVWRHAKEQEIDRDSTRFARLILHRRLDDIFT